MYKQEDFAWLKERRANITSQFGENGILAAIFERIGTENKFCCECGAGDGQFFSNTWPLINQDGWSSLQIEASETEFAKLGALYAGNKAVTCFNYKVEDSGAFSFDQLLKVANAPKNLDLLVIDVDSNDYWLFNSLLNFQPRVVVVEYDPAAPSDFVPTKTGNGQAGLNGLKKLGIGRYYWPVAITSTNVIFVLQELCPLLAGESEEAVADKELSAPEKPPHVAIVASTPRVGFLSTMDCVIQSVHTLPISWLRGEGAFWSQTLSRGISRAIKAGADYIVTVDYDTVFEHERTNNALAKLVCLLHDNPDVDVIVAAQMKREGGPLLASTAQEFKLLDPLVSITQGHFGLTIFRPSVFERISKPWFWEKPNDDGDWEENRIDADIGFWKNCEAAGINVQMSLDVMVGHIELVVTWPGQNLQTVYQPMQHWRDNGKPIEAFDRERVIAAVKANPALLYAPKLEMGG